MENHYYLPKKFGYDKRKPHLSSLILSGQMTREKAMQSIEDQNYEKNELEIDLNYFCKKMRISRSEFLGFVNSQNRNYKDFKNWDAKYNAIKKIQKTLTHFFDFSVGRGF